MAIPHVIGTLPAGAQPLSVFDDNFTYCLNVANLTGVATLTSEAATGGAFPGVTTSLAQIWASATPRLTLIDSTRTANNTTAEWLWDSGVLTGRFMNDAYNAAVNWIQITGGQAAGITGVATSSGSGTWAHVGSFSSSLPVGVGVAASASIILSLTQTTNNALVSTSINSNASNPLGHKTMYSGAAPNDTVHQFEVWADTGATRAEIRSNGGLANFSANNANLSDERLKTAIVDAPSYYAKFQAIKFRTFLYKDQTDEIPNLGVIAQEMEAVAPELVDSAGFGVMPEDGVPLKAIYQTDFQYATAKALQETIAALEALKGQFAAYVAAHP